MPPALAPIPPWALKEILVHYGLKVTYEDEYNWLVEDLEHTDFEPVVIPKLGDHVAVDVLMQAILGSKMGLNTYFVLKAKVLGEGYQYNVAAAGSDQPIN
jgi:hypothetical protein